MTYIIRHSERIDYAFPKYWEKTIRYKQNPKDPYITRHGIDIAKKATLKVLLDMKCYNLNIPKYIYSSPFTRCIETAIIIANTIELYTGKQLLIRVEYGLRENYTPTFIYKELMDSKLLMKNIIKRFSNHIDKFDLNYESICKFEEVQYNSLNPITEIKRPLDIIQVLHEKKDGLIVTHGLNILALYQFTTSDKLYRFNQSERLSGRDDSSFCSILKLL